MKRGILAGLTVLSLALVAPGSLNAGPHDEPGTPGEPNCRGQTAAFLAQAAKNGFADEAFRGIGGIARFADQSVREVQEVISQFCEG